MGAPPLTQDRVIARWRVELLSPGALRLALPAELLRAEAWRRFGVLLVPLVLAVAVVAGTWDSAPGIQAAAWPVAGALGVVLAFGALAVVRAVGRLRTGVRLEVDGPARTLTGFPEGLGVWGDARARLVTVASAEVSGVQVVQYEGPRTVLRLFVALRSGAQLQGPEFELSPHDVASAREQLEALGEALASRLEVPFAVELKR
jgi:hypothetical protein